MRLPPSFVLASLFSNSVSTREGEDPNMSQVSVSREEIRDAVRNYILEEFLPGEDPAALTDQTPLITSGILDSIATAKLVSHLEERFGVRFRASEVSGAYLDTVDRIAEIIERKLQG
jgi:acyl carrier protein